MKNFSKQNDKIKSILYSLAGIVGILNTALWIIVYFNEDFPYEHPIIFGIGLGSLFLIMITGFILSCIREYRYRPKEFLKAMKKMGLIILCSIIFTITIFTIFFISLRA